MSDPLSPPTSARVIQPRASGGVSAQILVPVAGLNRQGGPVYLEIKVTLEFVADDEESVLNFSVNIQARSETIATMGLFPPASPNQTQTLAIPLIGAIGQAEPAAGAITIEISLIPLQGQADTVPRFRSVLVFKNPQLLMQK